VLQAAGTGVKQLAQGLSISDLSDGTATYGSHFWQAQQYLLRYSREQALQGDLGLGCELLLKYV
jgi:hypothetical protein